MGAARNRRDPRSTIRRARTVAEFMSLPRRDQEKATSAAATVARMREGVPLTRAARENRISPSDVCCLAADALQRTADGTWIARKADRLLRIVLLLAPEGVIEVLVDDSRQAALVASYWTAANRYLSGDKTALCLFHDLYVQTADRTLITFMSGPELDVLEKTGIPGSWTLDGRLV